MKLVLIIIEDIFHKIISTWIFYLSVTQLTSSHYIEGSALLIAAVYYQKASIIDFKKYFKEQNKKEI